MSDLTGKTAIITGASSGIGAELALRMLRAGARVALFARRADRLAELAAPWPGQAMAVAGDLTRAEDRQRLLDAALRAWGKVDILVNNAGLGPYGAFLDADEDLWRGLFEVNLFAQVFLTQLVLPHMLSAGSGLIVNMASIGGLIAHADKVTPYVASKHALVGLTRGLAKDLEGSGVRVMAVCPHLTSTDFFAKAPGAELLAGQLEQMKRRMDTPEMVAEGIMAGLDGDGLILFPTEKPARTYARMRDL